MNILDFIPERHENAIPRGTLSRLTGLTDSQNRHLIMKARMDGNIILNLEDGRGYFIPALPEELPLVEKNLSKEKGRWIAARKFCHSMQKEIDKYIK